MTKISIDEAEYRSILKNAWKVDFEVNKALPNETSAWVKYHSTVLGVPETYIVWPLLAAASYCAQHSFVNVNDLHQEPILLYTLVAGRSGKWF